MKISDYVVEFLAGKGIRDLFIVSGGGIMHLVDSCGRNEKVRYWCNYHEQASAICAESYAKMREGPGACLVTTGPGACNALSGLAGAWVDSVPVICVCGQVRTDIVADYGQIRQKGPQEGNIVAMARPITKYAVQVREPLRIRYEMERAYHEATSGRPGPVLVEIPLDVQAGEVDPERLEGFAPRGSAGESDLRGQVSRVIDALRRAKRPLFVFGNGIHWARATDRLSALLERTDLPVVLPFSAKDLVPESHPGNMGIFGTAGQRRANFAVQNCDCLVAVAAGLSITKVGFNFERFAPKAFKVLVDIDPGQLSHQAVKADLAVQADAAEFLDEMILQIGAGRLEVPPRWRDACLRWKERYPILERPESQDPEHVNSYMFMDRLAERMTSRDALVTGNGLDCASYWQAFRVRPGQRTMLNGNWGSMGWDLPGAIGACIGGGRCRTVCVTGDGSLEWNVQELLFVGFHRLPVKIFVFNNKGYSAIRATQNAFFEGRFVGADAASGVADRDFRRLAEASGIGYDRILRPEELEPGLARVLDALGPVLCEVNIAREQWISPRASAARRADGTLESRPLEDMAPFLPREEVWENMHLFDDET